MDVLEDRYKYLVSIHVGTGTINLLPRSAFVQSFDKIYKHSRLTVRDHISQLLLRTALWLNVSNKLCILCDRVGWALTLLRARMMSAHSIKVVYIEPPTAYVERRVYCTLMLWVCVCERDRERGPCFLFSCYFHLMTCSQLLYTRACKCQAVSSRYFHYVRLPTSMIDWLFAQHRSWRVKLCRPSDRVLMTGCFQSRARKHACLSSPRLQETVLQLDTLDCDRCFSPQFGNSHTH